MSNSQTFQTPLAKEKTLPLAVDLDGTLVYTDTLHEMIVQLIKINPLMLLVLPFWFCRGRAYAKQRLYQLVGIDPLQLPYNEKFIQYLKHQKAEGRSLVLATGADDGIAKKVAAYLNCFDKIIASDGKTNMTGKIKAERLIHQFGVKNFDYAGDAPVDYNVWASARTAIVVNPKGRALERARKALPENEVILFANLPSRAKALWRLLSPERLICNFAFLLGFNSLSMGFWVFLSMSALSIAAFVFVQLINLKEDRFHFAYSHYPLARGDLQLTMGFLALAVFLILGFSIGYSISQNIFIISIPFFILLSWIESQFRYHNPMYRWYFHISLVQIYIIIHVLLIR